MSKIVILGGSSGIGAELARQYADIGNDVLIVGRDATRLKQVKDHMPARIQSLAQNLIDWRNPERTTLDQMAAKLGGLDVVVWVAAIMPDVGPDEFDTTKDAAMIETNFTAAVAWLNEAATRFQAAGSGTIVGVGSVAGDRGRSGKPAYNASKAALHTYLEALRNRLDRKGVKVVTIKPGPVDTPMTATHTVKKMPVEEAARRIIRASSRAGEHYLVFSHRVIFAAIRAVPGAIFRRINLP